MAETLTIVNGRLRVAECGGPLVLSPKPGGNEPCCCGECCIDESFFISGISKAPGPCPATVYGEKTITRPACSGTGPVRVTFYGSVDDELIINGEITEPEKYPFTPGCNGAHLIGGPPPPGSDKPSAGYSIVLDTTTFTIAAGDNHGGNTSYNLKICFAPV